MALHYKAHATYEPIQPGVSLKIKQITTNKLFVNMMVSLHLADIYGLYPILIFFLADLFVFRIK